MAIHVVVVSSPWLPFTSSPSSCLSSFSPSSTSATTSSGRSTRRSWKTCATPPTTGVKGPTTSSTSPQYRWLETCQIFGQVSLNLLHWKNGRDQWGNSLHPDQIIQNFFWNSMGKHAKLRNSKKPSRLPVRNCKHQSLLLCLVKLWRKTVRVKDPTKWRTRSACILEADESTRLRMGNSTPHNHADHIARTRDNSLQHCNLVHKFIPMSQAMKIPAAKAAVDKKWEKWRKFRRGTSRKSEVRKRWSMKQASGAQIHFASLMDVCHLKNAELEAKHQKYKRQVVLRDDIEKNDSVYVALRTMITSITSDSRKSHGYHFEIAWFRWTSSKRSIGWYPSKNGGCTQITENSQIGVSRHLDSPTKHTLALKMFQCARPYRSSWTKSVWSSSSRTIMGKAIWENPTETWLGENSKLGMSLCTSWKRIILICVCERHRIGWTKTKSWFDVESTQ